MRAFVISTFFFMAIVAAAYGAAMFEMGECPDGHVNGDSWELPGCQGCDCGDGWYGCYGCGLMAFYYDTYSCYVQDNLDKGYPQCCKQELICKGDEGFDESKLRPDPEQIRDLPVEVEELNTIDDPILVVDPDESVE
ncbi:unnamed protein product [Lymnaea stagnalis]|uniref:Uncharacterized protein n=1 Tax=Lymnaea stagnalis TaxID=6523 RepID=A0AAV2INM4_LYMST